MTSIARMAQIADERAAASKKDKPRKGAVGSQKRPDRPEAAAPAEVLRKAKSKLTEVDVVAIKDAPVKRRPGRPAGPERVALLVKVPPAMIGRLERTKVKRKSATRNDAIVALLDEGAEK